MKPAIIVHGGAGDIEDARRDRCVAGCEAAAQAGWARLQAGGSALDAVEAAVRALEDDPEFNAGYGAVLTRAATVEVDGCVMTGARAIGAVGGVPWLRHPVTLARRVLEDGEHILLVGDGALAFAREHGIEPESPDTLMTPRARNRFERTRARRRRAAHRRHRRRLRHRRRGARGGGDVDGRNLRGSAPGASAIRRCRAPARGRKTASARRRRRGTANRSFAR